MCICIYIYISICVCTVYISGKESGKDHETTQLDSHPKNHSWAFLHQVRPRSPFLARYPLEHLPRQAGCLLGCSHIPTPGLGGWTWHPIQHPSTTQGVDVHPLNLRNSASFSGCQRVVRFPGFKRFKEKKVWLDCSNHSWKSALHASENQIYHGVIP